MDAAAGSMFSRGNRDAVLRRRAAYHYDPPAGDTFYEGVRPANPRRAVMVHSCAIGLELLQNLAVSFPVSASGVRQFHDFSFMSVRPPSTDTEFDIADARAVKILGRSCPALYGFGHAFKGDSGAMSVELDDRGSILFGFTYVNDIVVTILELLKFRKRVLYVDIGTHHGDGVEESFFDTDRVMTVVFHRRGDFFPSTEHMMDTARTEGTHALNVPLTDDITDDNFLQIFKCIIGKAIQVHNPDLILLQCGPESLEGDSNNYFKLSDNIHVECLAFVKSFNPPTILLANTSSCWCFQEVVESETKPMRNFSYNSELVKSFRCSGFTGYVQSRKHKLNSTHDVSKMRDKVIYHLESLQRSEHIMLYSDATKFEAQSKDQHFVDIEISEDEFALVEGSVDTLKGKKPWSNIVCRPAANLINRFGRKLGSTSESLLSYDKNLYPYTDFCKYVGDYEVVSDGNVPPVLGAVSSVSRGAGVVSSTAGAIMRSGGKAIGNLGRKMQMLACPEAGSSHAGSKRVKPIIINSMAEADEQIAKWTSTGDQLKIDVPSDMSLHDAAQMFARFVMCDALELINGSPVINGKVDRLRGTKVEY